MSRTETDSPDTIEAPDDAYWGAQTQRSLENFAIDDQHISLVVIHALALIKKAAAWVNDHLSEPPSEVVRLIEQTADEVLADHHNEHSPLVVRQTGSGTQTSMNTNEVIAGHASEPAGSPRGGRPSVYPNDHVNRTQGSNDSFPTATHIAAAKAVHEQLPPTIAGLFDGPAKQLARHASLVRTGRTHLMDITPVTFSQKFSVFVAQLDYAEHAIRTVLPAVYQLTQGGTTVGTRLNASRDFADVVATEIATESGLPLAAAPSKFAILVGHESLVTLSDALKSLTVALMKIINDLHLFDSGPHTGFAEVKLSTDEPGSLIMPGKINPVRCEALSTLACQVMGNNSTISFATNQGYLQLNVFKPVIVYNLPESIHLLIDGCRNFNKHCVVNPESDAQHMTDLLECGLIPVTALNPYIGYDKAAEITKKAYTEGTTLRTAALQLGYLNEAQFDGWVRLEQMLEAGHHG